MKAFENAIMVHAAIAGSTNALLHLPSIAYELGLEIKPELFDEINRRIPYLLNVKPSGKYPVEYFYAAGGVPAIMEELRDFLHLDAMTVTGKTVGEIWMRLPPTIITRSTKLTTKAAVSKNHRSCLLLSTR